MQNKLSELAQVFSGYTFRSELKESGGDNHIFVLQSKDLSAGVEIRELSSLKVIDASLIRSPYFLEKGDVLLTIRGSGRNFMRAAVFTATETNVIASSTLAIIRLHSKEVAPEYLALYLNSSAGQRQLQKMLFGATIINGIRISALKDLLVPIFSKQMQNTLIVFANNVQAQRNLLARKRVLLQEIADSVFNNNNNLIKE